MKGKNKMTKINQYEFSIEIDEYIFNRFVKDNVRKPYNNYEDYKDTFPNCKCNFILRKGFWAPGIDKTTARNQ